MKDVWVEINKWDRDVVTTCIESGVDAIICPVEMNPKIKELGKISLVNEDGDLVPEKDVTFLYSKEEFNAFSGTGFIGGTVCINFYDWDIVGLENIVALGCKVLVKVNNEDRLEVALGVLEKGVSGVIFSANSFSDVKQLKKMILRVKANKEEIILDIGKIRSVRQVGMGDRVCVDLALMLEHGEGLLVGNASSFLFLVHGETLENPYVEPRPFRVNAGGVHAYVLTPQGKTKYLCELKSGDKALVVSYNGMTREGIVGRVKIERRPMLLVTAEINGIFGSIILQNAETIRLVGSDGSALSVVSLKKGDEIVVRRFAGGRHFGMAVEETIWER